MIAINNTKKKIIPIAINSKIGIQNGENTHHQDQSILPVNLRIKNTRNKTVVVPTPLDVVFSILF